MKANALPRPFDAARFQQSLRDAQVWAERRGATEWRPGLLRDPRMRPFPAGASPNCSRDVMAAAVDALIMRRRALLGEEKSSAAPAHGRLLACDWNSSMWDTLAKDASGALFDDEDRPPWDLWVDVLFVEGGNDLLLAWIPDAFAPLVDAGISVNPVDCIHWCRLGSPALPPVPVGNFAPRTRPLHRRHDPALVRFLLSSRMPPVVILLLGGMTAAAPLAMGHGLGAVLAPIFVAAIGAIALIALRRCR